MLNNRDNNYEGHEDSEYHFSDEEEVSYEADADQKASTKAAPSKVSNILNRLGRSKRMVISGVVFLVLVFVVYKMVTPTVTTAPTTDITPPAILAQTPATAVPAQPPVAPVVASQPAIVPVTSPVPSAPMQVVAPVQPQPQAQAVTPSQPMQSIPAAPLASIQQNPATVAQPSMMQSTQTVTPVQPPQEGVPPAPITNLNAPTVIAPPGAAQPPQTSPYAQNVAAINTGMANMQMEYAQKVDAYATQNKALQDQMQALNTRVALMENQINQLVQALTREQPPKDTQTFTPPPSTAPEPKIAYNVQAIIPGRAWLRSDNGETVTVAEGDLIKGVGRVTKIDPYDGVVEINTGSRVVSISYGNGT